MWCVWDSSLVTPITQALPFATDELWVSDIRNLNKHIEITHFILNKSNCLYKIFFPCIVISALFDLLQKKWKTNGLWPWSNKVSEHQTIKQTKNLNLQKINPSVMLLNKLLNTYFTCIFLTVSSEKWTRKNACLSAVDIFCLSMTHWQAYLLIHENAVFLYQTLSYNK